MSTEQPEWQAKAAAKQSTIMQKIPLEWRLPQPIPSCDEVPDVTGDYIQTLLTAHEVEITEADAPTIVAQTSLGVWTAVEVAKAFCHRAAIAHQLVNCLHEIFFDAAIEDAQRLDDDFARTKVPVGPLHGLPVSLKDQFHVKGVETTMGYVGWIDTFQGVKGDQRRASFESELVQELRRAGAVLYVKTSVPTTLMTTETINNIIGYTWNPKNRLLSSGGSSGGEAALMALRGSPGGFGTDIGGSVRIPASYNGLFGLRPSTGRLPYYGAATSLDGQNTILSVVGSLSPTIGGLELLFKSVLGQQPWNYDPSAVPMPWSQSQVDEIERLIAAPRTNHGALAFGVLRHDGMIRPYPPVARALNIVVEALKRAGHKVIEYTPPSYELGRKIMSDALFADGGADVRHHLGLSNEPMPEQIRINKGPAVGPQKTVLEMAAINLAKRAYQRECSDYWNSTANLTGTGRPVDAILSPVAAHSAVVPNKSFSMEYTLIPSLLDYSAIVMPVTHVDSAVDFSNPASEYLHDMDRAAQPEYNPKVQHGSPVGIQLLGRRYTEEKLITLARYLVDLIKE